MMKDLPLSKVYQLLEPGPVVLVTTTFICRANKMTMSRNMMVEFEPPLIACVDRSASHSFAALLLRRHVHHSEITLHASLEPFAAPTC